MNHVYFRRILAAQRLRLAIVMLALAAWGSLMPVIWSEFGRQFEQLMDSGLVPDQFRQMTQFGGGDITRLAGMIAIGFIHPIAVILLAVFTVGFTVASVAGERQRGTLEVLLARPISRRTLYGTLFLASLVFVGLAILALLSGTLVGAALWNLLDELQTPNLPALWLNGVLLHLAFASIALGASVTFDRLTPALAVTLAVLLMSYFFQVLGSLWPDADFLQPYSLFHYLQPQKILEGKLDPFHLVLLSTVIVAGVIYALIVFPRRDLAAPT
ncbi:MAG TPA: ABC transporter permease subunit [Candidatus Limnocylindrales bacterium]|nr:ABC transporter permease subunit [Candidatus Limnocylindrales bacterium]